jgi:hypothetical protein
MKITVSTEQEKKFPALYINKDYLSGQQGRIILLVAQENDHQYASTILDSYDNTTWPIAMKVYATKQDFVRFDGTVSLCND